MDALIEKHPNKIAAVIGLLVLGFVYWRLMPTLPTVMQDELVYMIQSRRTNPSDASFPNYLFSWVYSSTLWLGTEFYNYVKVLNSIFLAGFGAIIYLLSRGMFGLWISIGVALAAVAGPASLVWINFHERGTVISHLNKQSLRGPNHQRTEVLLSVRI